MKKVSPKQGKKKVSHDIPFTNAEAARFFGSVKEHFDDNFKVIRERFDGTDEKIERKFNEVNSKLDKHTQILGRHELILHEHTQILGRLMIDVEEVKSGMREKVSLDQFNKLETRLVLLESIVLSGRGKKEVKTGK